MAVAIGQLNAASNPTKTIAWCEVLTLFCISWKAHIHGETEAPDFNPAFISTLKAITSTKFLKIFQRNHSLVAWLTSKTTNESHDFPAWDSSPQFYFNMSTSITPDSRPEGLRERHVVPTINEESSSGLSSGQDTPQNEGAEEREKKTFGRTPDGTSTSLPHYDICHCSQARVPTLHFHC